MKIIITENQGKQLMIQNIIDNCVTDMRDWCDEVESYDTDDDSEFCRSLSSLSKIEIRTLHRNEIGIIIYLNNDGDGDADMGSILYDLSLCLKNNIGDGFKIKLLNVIEE
jgi:hypothetical protein